jgi:hypothetical protein
MAWEHYLLNEFVDDCLEAQNLGKEFHYNWVILLIAMILWRPPHGHEEDAVDAPPFITPRFLTLQYTKEQAVQAKHHKSFQKWCTHNLSKANLMLHILKSIMTRYEAYLQFECDFHNVFIYPHADKQATTTMLPFCIMEEDIHQGVEEWDDDFKPPFKEDKGNLETRTKRNQEKKRVTSIP